MIQDLSKMSRGKNRKLMEKKERSVTCHLLTLILEAKTKKLLTMQAKT